MNRVPRSRVLVVSLAVVAGLLGGFALFKTDIFGSSGGSSSNVATSGSEDSSGADAHDADGATTGKGMSPGDMAVSAEGQEEFGRAATQVEDVAGRRMSPQSGPGKIHPKP